MMVREPSQAQPQLHRVYPGVERCQIRIRDVHEAHIRAPSFLAGEKMQADRASGCEVDPGSSRRNLGVGKQNPSAKLDVRHDAAVRVEIPNEREWIYRCAISRIRLLKNHEDWNRVDRVLESSA
jgi:hypothetical protein